MFASLPLLLPSQTRTPGTPGGPTFLTTLVLGNTAYSSDGTPYAGFAGAGGTKSWADGRILGLKFNGDDEQYSTLEFTALGCGPAFPFVPGIGVQLVTSYTDGSTPMVRFTGDLQKPAIRPSDQGPAYGYTCTDLKRRGDYLTVIGSDGSGVASFNLEPADALYLFTQSGKTVGQIMAAVLTSTANAAALAGVGIQYTGLTAADLAGLAIVPARPVHIQGEGMMSALDGFLKQWYPQGTTYVQPDGAYRVISIFGRPTYTLAVPGDTTPGDPIDPPEYSGPDLTDCYTAVQITGQDIQGVVLSVVAGTLASTATPALIAAWTSAAFNSPTNTQDQGNTSGVTTSSCTVHSDHPTVHWVANFWNGKGGVIVLENLLVAGMVTITTLRQVTSCTAMSPGGTATITWDSSLPLDSTAYSRYRLYSTLDDLNKVDREFAVREPAGPSTPPGANQGLNTYVGAHMYPRFPYGFPWVNTGSITTIFEPAAVVTWSQNGLYPWSSWPVPVEINPSNGTVLLGVPAVFASASLAGMPQVLQQGYPANTFTGKWVDVQVAIPYNRGDLAARSPASGFSGTAYSKYGIQKTKLLPLTTFLYNGDTIALQQLAFQHLVTMQDAVFEGSVTLHYDSWTPTFDPLAIGYALRLAYPGASSEIDGVTLPVRSFSMEWPHQGADVHRITFSFSNRRNQFQGDDLYIHPMASPARWGMQGGSQLFVAGQVGDHSGTVAAEDFNAAQLASQAPPQSPGDLEAGDLGGDAGAFQVFDDGGHARRGKGHKDIPDAHRPSATAGLGKPIDVDAAPRVDRPRLADLRGTRDDDDANQDGG